MKLLNTAIQYDHSSFDWCQRRRRRNALVLVSRQISRSADGYLYLLFGVVALSQQYYQVFEIAVIAFVLERTLYLFLKRRVRRNRPPDAIPGFCSIIQASDKFSFPSGHTSAAFLMAGLLLSSFPATVWFMYPWACCVAWSRVMLGVHFPSDTVAGAVLGSSTAFLCSTWGSTLITISG